jgi:outer membrane protein assembly factor BamB
MTPRRLMLAVFLAMSLLTVSRADDWPQWQGPKRDSVWRESGIIDKFPADGPKVLWRTPIGPGYTGPAVVGDRVYVMDREGDPLARGAETSGKNGLKGKERVLCLDAKSGKEIWKHEYDCLYKIYYPSGPRATPVVHEGKVYTLGSMGDVYCLDAATGKPDWSKNLATEYKAKLPVWGFAGHPLVVGDKLFCLVGGKDSVAVALDRHTGKELWHNLTVEEVGYAPPMLYEVGGKRQLIIWHTEAVNALDPDTGTVLWSQKFPVDRGPERPGISVSSPRLDGNRLFVTCVHHGPLMLELAADKPGAKIVWKGKSDSVAKPDGLHSLMSSPIIKDGHIYGICAFGELRCLKADTGEQLWSTFQATTGKKALFATAFLVQQADRFFLFNDIGDLIIARLTPKGYEEISRAHILEPTLLSRGRDVVWSHPAFANKCMYARNDKEIVCISLAG